MKLRVKTKYWINTITLDHVQAGEMGGFTQANHGNPRNLNKLQRGDLMVFYSPREKFQGNIPLQAFTAVGQVSDDVPYQVEQDVDFHPYRRNMDFLKCNQVPIRPLINKLSFIKNKTHWGMVFRQGMFEIPESDFAIIAEAMEVEIKANP
jgi:predicted RNA-binding protein